MSGESGPGKPPFGELTLSPEYEFFEVSFLRISNSNGMIQGKEL
jgi:hypothetical protein